MTIHKKLLLLVITVSLTSYLYAMEAESATHEYLKIQDLPEGQLVIADDGGKIEKGTEYIDLNAEDPITYERFSDLLAARAAYGIPYILAVVAYKQQEPLALRHTYYDAATINEFLFGEIKQTKSHKNTRVCKYSFNKNQIHPATRAQIDSVTYIALDPGQKTAKIIGTSADIKEGSANEQAFTRLFSGTKAFDKELAGQKDAATLKVIAQRIKEHYRKIEDNLKGNKKR